MRVVKRDFQEPFWVVWCPNRGKSMIRHETFKEAYDEAVRLSEKENETFYVLKAEQAVARRKIDETVYTFYSEDAKTIRTGNGHAID